MGQDTKEIRTLSDLQGDGEAVDEILELMLTDPEREELLEFLLWIIEEAAPRTLH